jgi:hypothetical protein
MPTVYLPEYGLSDSRRGLCDAVQLMGLHTMLIIPCLEMLTITEGRGKMHDLLPETTKNIPDKYIEPCFEKAGEIIERFKIKSHFDFLEIRPLLKLLYSGVSFINGTEYVLDGDRWYSREWVKHTIKKPKHDYGILLYLDNTSGDSGLAIAGGGTEFKLLKYGTVMKRNTSRMKLEVGKNLKAYTEQEHLGAKLNLLKIYSKFDLFNMAERSRAVTLCAIEAMQMARQIMYQKPCTTGDRTMHQRIGVDDLLLTIEIAGMQFRHVEADKRPFLTEAATIGLAEKCEGNKLSAEIAALLTKTHFEAAPKPKRAKKAPVEKVPAKSTKANTVKSNKK